MPISYHLRGCTAQLVMITTRLSSVNKCSDLRDLVLTQIFILRQVNGVNGGDTVSFDVCLSVCACAAALNANSSKTVKAMDFRFDSHVPRDSPDMTP